MPRPHAVEDANGKRYEVVISPDGEQTLEGVVTEEPTIRAKAGDEKALLEIIRDQLQSMLRERDVRLRGEIARSWMQLRNNAASIIRLSGDFHRKEYRSGPCEGRIESNECSSQLRLDLPDCEPIWIDPTQAPFIMIGQTIVKPENLSAILPTDKEVHSIGRQILLATSFVNIWMKELRAQESPRETLGDLLTTLMNNPQLLEAIRGFDHRVRNILLGLTLDYGIVMRGLDDLPQFLMDLKGMTTDNRNHHLCSLPLHQRYGLLGKAIGRILNIDASDPSSDPEILAFCQQRYVQEGYYFHGFSGSFEERILLQGLDPEQRPWSKEQREGMIKFFKEKDLPLIFCCAGIDDDKCIFLSDDPSVIFRYANASPEWFAQFCGEGYGIDQQAYARKDYQACMRNLVVLLKPFVDAGKLTNAEATHILQFLYHQWMTLVESPERSHPKVALVKRSSIKRDAVVVPGSVRSLDSKMAGLMHGAREVNLRVEGVIPPQDMIMVTLPSYEELYPKEES